MLIVSLESPFEPSETDLVRYDDRYTRAELLRQNIIYARLALEDAVLRHETAFAAHLLYTQLPDEMSVLVTRSWLEFHHCVDLVALYIDLGMSEDMRLAKDNAQLLGVQQTTRSLFAESHRDVRDVLAERSLVAFPHLEELGRAEFLSHKAGT